MWRRLLAQAIASYKRYERPANFFEKNIGKVVTLAFPNSLPYKGDFSPTIRERILHGSLASIDDRFAPSFRRALRAAPHRP
jgi:hypothetical protein